MKNIEGNANIERVDTTSFKESRKLLVNKDLAAALCFLFCLFFYIEHQSKTTSIEFD